MVAGEEPVAELFEPLLGAIVLAPGAVAVAAGVVAVLELAAVVAALEGAAQGWRATLDDVVHGPPVRGQELPGVGLDVGRPRSTEDVRQLHHRPTSRDGGSVTTPNAASAALHQVVDGVDGGVAEFPGQVGVDGRGLRAIVPQVVLDQAEIDAGFEKMRGVTVAERVDVGPLVDAARLDRSHERALETGSGNVPHRWITQHPSV